MSKLLLEAGSSIELKNHKGETALDFARDYGDAEFLVLRRDR
jgi:ankyrin repeat protein